MTLIEQRLKDQLKLQGTTEDKIERLEECKTQIVIYSPKFPSLEKPALGKSQSPPKNGKHELNDSKQKFEESSQKLLAGKSLYFQPSDFKKELKNNWPDRGAWTGTKTKLCESSKTSSKTN